MDKFSAKKCSLQILSKQHVMLHVTLTHRYLLLPVEENQGLARIKIIQNGDVKQVLNVKLAIHNSDYSVPLALQQWEGKTVLLDIVFSENTSVLKSIEDYVCWELLQYSETFDTENREKFRPIYHHTPSYGWMNDPNGLFYNKGIWHLYYQYNPYGSQWENMTWGHATSENLVHWQHEGTPLLPDALGMMFSGSAVVDHHNTAGFGEGAIVAFYTAAGDNQTQCIAFSNDEGKTFQKYSDNPIITAPIADFRDPHVFWNEDIQQWNLILAAGKEMFIYTSKNLKVWHFESSFGFGYDTDDEVWECPDLMKLPIKGTDRCAWLLICNINPGGPFGGSATKYFVGSFNGYEFNCESNLLKSKWMDYGKDHYAMVTFDNAPEHRRVGIAWMSNWEYANEVPTQQFRSANTVPRDLGLFVYDGETYVSSIPSEELLHMRKEIVDRPMPACELVIDITSQQADLEIVLQNHLKERVIMKYKPQHETFSFDRKHSGNVSFHSTFAKKIEAPTFGKINQLRIFIDKCSIEIFDAEGKMVMTNLVFPTESYDEMKLIGSATCTIYRLE